MTARLCPSALRAGCLIQDKALALLSLTLLLFACASRVSAQYPGGYPGSGGSSSTPSPGWSAVDPNGNLGSPGLADDNTFYNFDWTRLYLARNCVYNGISDPDYSGPYQLQSTAGSISVGTSYDCTQAIIDITGTSTVKWQWTPPNKPSTSQPDTEHFPAPPLFVLGRISASSTAYNVDGTTNTPTGVSGSGSVSDGWGWNPSFNTIPGNVPSNSGENPRRHVLTAAPSGSNFQVTMSPGAHLQASASNPTQGGRTGSSGNMTGFTGISEAAMPIMLSSPSPLTNPKLGDGTNQFVYDSAQPQGNLILPGVISIPGTSVDDTNWLLRDPQHIQSSHVDISTDLPAESPIRASFLQNAAGQINYMYGQQSPYSNGMWFLGLPNANSGFGNHLETLLIDGAPSEQAHIQTFFTGTASNYPGADTDKTANGFDTPNWYHYYSQVYKPTAAQGGYDQSGQIPSHIDLTSPYTVHIHDDAYGGYTLPGNGLM